MDGGAGEAMIEVLHCVPLQPSEPSARLDAFLSSGARADLALWMDRQGETTLVRSRVRTEGGERTRTRVRSTVHDEAPRELDRVEFLLGVDVFVERTPDGLELTLPAVLHRNVPVRPRKDDPRTVTLRYAGLARLTLGAWIVERRAILLRLGEGEGAWDQWMVEGVGEVALGPADRPPDRWLVAWRAGDHGDTLFAAPRA